MNIYCAVYVVLTRGLWTRIPIHAHKQCRNPLPESPFSLKNAQNTNKAANYSDLLNLQLSIFSSRIPSQLIGKLPSPVDHIFQEYQVNWKLSIFGLKIAALQTAGNCREVRNSPNSSSYWGLRIKKKLRMIELRGTPSPATTASRGVPELAAWSIWPCLSLLCCTISELCYTILAFLLIHTNNSLSIYNLSLTTKWSYNNLCLSFRTGVSGSAHISRSIVLFFTTLAMAMEISQHHQIWYISQAYSGAAQPELE